jgi:hypothetical protein
VSLSRSGTEGYPGAVTRSLYAAFGERVVDADAGPGTTHTYAIETVDNDEALLGVELLNLDPKPDPRPNPGTTLTATVETTDEDASASMHHLR